MSLRIANSLTITFRRLLKASTRMAIWRGDIGKVVRFLISFLGRISLEWKFAMEQRKFLVEQIVSILKRPEICWHHRSSKIACFILHQSPKAELPQVHGMP